MSLLRQPRGVMNGGHLLLRCRRRRHRVCTMEMVCECEVVLEQVAQLQHRIPETTTIIISRLLNLPAAIPRYHPLCPLRDRQPFFLVHIHPRNPLVAQLLAPFPYHPLLFNHKPLCPARSAPHQRCLSMRHACEKEMQMLWRSTRTGSGVEVELRHLQTSLHRVAAIQHRSMACQCELRTISPH